MKSKLEWFGIQHLMPPIRGWVRSFGKVMISMIIVAITLIVIQVMTVITVKEVVTKMIVIILIVRVSTSRTGCS